MNSQFKTILNYDFPEEKGNLFSFSVKSYEEAEKYALLYTKPGIVAVYGTDVGMVWIKNIYETGPRHYNCNRIIMGNIAAKVESITCADFNDPDGDLVTLHAEDINEAKDISSIYCKPNIISVYDTISKTLTVKDLSLSGPRMYESDKIAFVEAAHEMTILESCDFSDAQGDLFSYEVENIDEVNECALLYCQPGIAVVYDAECNRVSVKDISSAGSKINHPSRSVYIYSPGSVVKIGCCDYPDNSPDDSDSGAIFTIQDCPSIQEA